MSKTLSGLDRWGERGRRSLPVEIIQRALDPAPGEPPELPRTRNQWRSPAYEKLVTVASGMPRNPHLVRSVCDRAVRFALGLEAERSPEQQILASVSRAFALTDSYAAACADERDRVEAVHRNREIVGTAMRLLTETSPLLCKRGGEAFAWEQEGPIADLLNALASMHIPSKPSGFETVGSMRAPIAEGLAALNQLLELSEGRSSFAPENPDPDRFRRIFVVHLAEIYTAHTGELPHFDATERKRKPTWLALLTASLETVGFSTHGLDDMLRDLKRGKARQRKAENSSNEDDDFDNGSWLVASLEILRESLEMTPPCGGYRLTEGDLPSSGWMHDVSRQLKPATFDKAYPHFALDDEAAEV